MVLFDTFDKSKTNCPYCETPLNPIPTRKKKCPSCGKFIYMRTRPSDHKRILATEKDAKRIDDEWKYKQILQRFNVSQEEYRNEEKVLTKKWKAAPSQRDIMWTILNDKLLSAMKQTNWQQMKMLYFEQALFLEDEGKNPFKVLQESKRCELRGYQSFGMKKVQVLSGGSSCDKCKTLNGKIFTIKEALETMPIPIDNCENSYRYCRCVYLPMIN